jgi:hypothetical protein
MTYKFPQFKVEISNPTISVDLDTIQDKAISKLLSVSLTLATDSAHFRSNSFRYALFRYLGG